MKIDPPLKAPQLAASKPDASIWVSASAGTGKTKVLIARLLRLMLDGTAPEKILCITYTKSAAAEILDRLQDATRQWAIADKAHLVQALQNLTDRMPDDAMVRRARSLFALILNAQGGMRIMTIHAFCQSILSRYPIEANVPTQFTVADDQKTSDLMNDAKHHLLWEETGYNDDFLLFMDYLDEGNQNDLLKSILAKRYYLLQLIERFPTRQDYRAYLCALLDIDPGLDKEALQKQFDAGFPAADLQKLMPLLAASPAKTMAEMLQVLESRNPQDYLSLFVTDKKELRKSLLVKAIADAHPWAEDFMRAEQQRVLGHVSALDRLNIIAATTALYAIVSAILAIYQQIKRNKNILDYEDQISATRALLCDSAQYLWVLYKLDNQIEHLLIDEAQDTSPAQWDIVDAITDEFFAGIGRYESGERTVFVVGDEKQSIFSFQNADPQGFFDSGNKLAVKAVAAEQKWRKVGLHENFRSSPVILSLVDTVFSDPALAHYISRGADAIQHTPAHGDRAGKIDLWPLAPYSKDVPTHIQQYRLAEKISSHVQAQLKRPGIRPGDIMILVNRRQPMAPKLMKAFKDRDIPIMGPDRTVLAEHMAVMDCLAFIQYALNLHDEYNTACLLKSPFIGFDDDQLLALRECDRDRTLAQNLPDCADKALNDYLARHLQSAKTYSPVAFLHAILDQPCPNDAVSGRHALIRHLGYDAHDILDNLIDAAYYFENSEPAQLQNFYNWMLKKTDVIKKDQQDTDQSMVRLMTVHASKGLQSKIVILADATSKPRGYKYNDDVLWFDDPAQGFIWPAGKNLNVPLVSQLKEQRQLRHFAEYYRLLYVALTRAENELVVCGCESARETGKDYLHWYDIIAKAAPAMPSVYKQTKEQEHLVVSFDTKEETRLRSHVPKADGTAFNEKMRVKPPHEPSRTQPLRPSRASEEEPAVISPLAYAPQENHFRRGQLLHRLFRTLPDFPVAEHEQVLKSILSNERAFTAAQKNQMTEEVLSVMHHPDYAPLFSPQARGEVSLIGEINLNGKAFAVSGQVDRLLIEPHRVIVVDYKTNRPASKTQAEVAEAYIRQMQSYKLLLEKIYPGRDVQAALLWTSLPYLLSLSL